MFPFSRRRKRRTTNNPNAKVVNWIIIAIVAVGVLNNVGKGRPLPEEASKAKFKEAIEQAAPKKPMDMGKLEDLIFSEGSGTLRMQDVETGEGEPAVCGQKVTLSYDTFAADDSALPDSVSKEKPLTFQIGKNNVMPALAMGVVGMKKGGLRSLFAPPHSAYGIKDFTREGMPANAPVRFSVRLLDITPPLPEISGSAYRIITSARGAGPTITCGKQIRAHVTVWSVDGKKLFTTHEDGKALMVFTPGQSEVMLGLEQGVIGMHSASTRTLIIPPAFQKTLHGNTPEVTIPLPEKQVVIVDVESIP